MAHITVSVSPGPGARFASLDEMVGTTVPLRVGETQAGRARITAVSMLDGGRRAELQLVFDEGDSPDVEALVLAAATANGWVVAGDGLRGEQ